jgi:sucrose-6-phosphate hydrolase SacC (GH32 family)
MNNWQTNLIPTYPWRSAMSIPRELTLRRIDGEIRLCQRPVRELETLRGNRRTIRNLAVRDAAVSLGVKGQQLDIIAEFDIGTAREFGLRVLKGAEEQTAIGFDASAKSLYVDRTRSGIVDFHEKFPGRHAGPLIPENGRIRLRILVDRSSVEVFGNHGETAITDLVFPAESSDAIELFAIGGECTLVTFDAWPLQSVWKR